MPPKLRLQCADGASAGGTSRCRIDQYISEDECQQRIYTIEQELANSARRRQPRRRKRAAQRDRISTLQKELLEAREEAAALRDGGAAETDATRKLQAKVEELKQNRTELDQLRSDVRKAEAGVEELQKQLEQAQFESQELRKKVKQEEANRRAVQDVVIDLRTKIGKPKPPQAPAPECPVCKPCLQPAPECPVCKPCSQPAKAQGCKYKLQVAQADNARLQAHIQQLSSALGGTMSGQGTLDNTYGLLARLTQLFDQERSQLTAHIDRLEKMNSRVTGAINPDLTAYRQQLESARGILQDLELRARLLENGSLSPGQWSRELDGISRNAFVQRRHIDRLGAGIGQHSAELDLLRREKEALGGRLSSRIDSLEVALAACEQNSQAKQMHIDDLIAQLRVHETRIQQDTLLGRRCDIMMAPLNARIRDLQIQLAEKCAALPDNADGCCCGHSRSNEQAIDYD